VNTDLFNIPSLHLGNTNAILVLGHTTRFISVIRIQRCVLGNTIRRCAFGSHKCDPNPDPLFAIWVTQIASSSASYPVRGTKYEVTKGDSNEKSLYVYNFNKSLN